MEQREEYSYENHLFPNWWPNAFRQNTAKHFCFFLKVSYIQKQNEPPHTLYPTPAIIQSLTILFPFYLAVPYVYPWVILKQISDIISFHP